VFQLIKTTFSCKDDIVTHDELQSVLKAHYSLCNRSWKACERYRQSTESTG